jgi:hypothetical protein
MEPATPAPGADSPEPSIRFVLPEPLLQELRAHRDRARAERAAKPLPPRLPPVQPTPGERIMAWLRSALRWLPGRLTGRRYLHAEALAAAKRPLAFTEVAVALNRPEDVDLLVNAFARGMRDLQDEIEEQHDAFLLYPGMGPMAYLTADGRILEDGRTWDGEELKEVTAMDSAVSWLVAGAKNTRIKGLIDLIPKRTGKIPCPVCHGSRYMAMPHQEEPEMVCLGCSGWGDIDEADLAKAEQWIFTKKRDESQHT